MTHFYLVLKLTQCHWESQLTYRNKMCYYFLDQKCTLKTMYLYHGCLELV